MNRTEIGSLGEFGLIEHLTKNIKLINKSTIKGIGDDCAVLDYKNKLTLLSTDLLIEGVHFDLTYTPLKHLGYKAAVVNFSDLAAMNAKPQQLLVGLALSNRFSVEAVEEIYQGIMLACKKYKVDLSGGDTTSSPSGLFISLTVSGAAEKEDIVYRNTAKINELICVSGDLGAAYIGLQVLEREKAVFKANPSIQPELQGNEYILERQLKPEARTDIIDLFKEKKIKPTAMIDISDGLASDLLHICRQSGLGFNIYEEKLPIDVQTSSRALEFNISPTTAVLNGGEDYELLFTISQNDYDKIKTLPQVTILGHTTDKNSGYNLITPDQKQIEITAQGWDALLKK
ncbi:MAG: thiamine-phosphate kinase [Bacteroidales bacterium]|nr:thiamine-phosphate kinase [Bacteroidales bacterium]